MYVSLEKYASRYLSSYHMKLTTLFKKCSNTKTLFRYGMNTATCRAKVLVNYFGEDFIDEQCHMYVSCFLYFILASHAIHYVIYFLFFFPSSLSFLIFYCSYVSFLLKVRWWYMHNIRVFQEHLIHIEEDDPYHFVIYHLDF